MYPIPSIEEFRYSSMLLVNEHLGVMMTDKLTRYILTLLIVLAMPVGLGAAVKDTKHNFTSPTSSPTAYFYGTRQVCVFCHTTHNASQSDGPLWNHESNPGQSYQMYDSPTLDMPQSIAPHKGSLVCLSCHDGTIAVNSLNNLPGPEGAGNFGSPGGPSLDGAGKLLTSADAYVGTDLSDDHPVGITYDASQDPTGFVAKTGNPASYPDKLLSEGLYVECVSCHNPHDDTYSDFLIESNDNSNLCTRCHTK
jgi:predicted CXXCH cytochrome family protein